MIYIDVTTSKPVLIFLKGDTGIPGALGLPGYAGDQVRNFTYRYTCLEKD